MKQKTLFILLSLLFCSSILCAQKTHPDFVFKKATRTINPNNYSDIVFLTKDNSRISASINKVKLIDDTLYLHHVANEQIPLININKVILKRRRLSNNMTGLMILSGFSALVIAPIASSKGGFNYNPYILRDVFLTSAIIFTTALTIKLTVAKRKLRFDNEQNSWAIKPIVSN